MSDLRIQRDRQSSLEASIDNAAIFDADCSAAMVATTTMITTYPTTANTFFAANPTEVGGTETEGGAATYTTGTQVVYALNVGTQVPSPGTQVVCHAVGGRWVFRYDG